MTPFEMVKERVQSQAHDHWHEFSVIVASADILLALVLLGRATTGMHVDRVHIVSVGIALASILATVLAYYSIQVGILFVFGPLGLSEVLTSFLVVAAQLGLFLWPAHVLGAQPDLHGLRHWLLLFALFAFAGPLANRNAYVKRRKHHPGVASEAFELHQRGDRIAGYVTCVIMIGCWALTFDWEAWMEIGVGIAIISAIGGIISQAMTARILTADSLGSPS